MGGRGKSNSSTSTPGANLSHWNVVRNKGNMYVYEMKNPKAALKPPVSDQIPNSFVIMYRKATDKMQGIKSITSYDANGIRDYEIHTADHKGLGPHFHKFINGTIPDGEPQSLTPELQSILDKAKEV